MGDVISFQKRRPTPLEPGLDDLERAHRALKAARDRLLIAFAKLGGPILPSQPDKPATILQMERTLEKHFGLPEGAAKIEPGIPLGLER